MGTIILLSIAISIASIVFVIWFMKTVATSLKEMSFQLTRIAAMMTEQKNRQDQQ